MFTGIIEGIGKIVAKRSAGGGVALEIEAGFALSDPKEGESIAVSGVCLTAYDIHGHRFLADVSPETLSRTKLGMLANGDRVNLERAVRLSDRLGGHLVSGHVDCLAKVVSRKELGDYTIFSFEVAKDQERYLIEKGSLAIDGVSLTVNSCGPGHFSVSIIPHTLKTTTLEALENGSKVNIEVDIIGKYIEKLLFSGGKKVSDTTTSAIDAKFLGEHGYL
jgi:riboflavin synthase